MADQLRVGPVYGGTGTTAPKTGTPDGAQRIADAHAHFYDLVRQGIVFAAVNTAARALTVSLTTTASLAIWNPPSSGKLGIILSTAFRWGSGTFAAGYMTHVLFPNQTGSPGGTVLNPINMLTGNIGGSLKAFELATGMTTAVQVRLAASHGAITTDQVTTAFSTVNRELVDGAILIGQGTAYGIISNSGAGTSPTAWFDYMYAEIPYFV